MSLRQSPKLGLILLIVVLTAVATVVGFRSDEARLDREQAGLADNAAAVITRTFEASGARLEDVATGVGVDGSTGGEDFARLARPVLSENAITAVALARKVSHADRPAYERSRGRPIFSDEPRGTVRAPSRVEYYVIDRATQLRPRFRLGLDTRLLPDAGKTAMEAIRTGRAKVTSPTALSNDGGIGLVAYVPVFSTGKKKVPRLLKDRFAVLTGFTIGLYEAKGLA
nr:CHASE domain-containing protein [Thermoleophilaceae bacterium]